MAMSMLFSGMKPGESLDAFHQRCVVPDPLEVASRNADVDEFVRFLHSQFNERPYTVAKVVKGGSLGKGTAVRGTTDIDLVVFVNGLTSIQDLEAHRERLLDNLHDKVRRYGPWRGRMQFDGRTQFALKYKLDGQELDILPAVNILGRSLAQLYWGMSTFPGGDIHAGQQYSASLAPLQIDFVKRQGEDVKRVIRLVKMWKKERGLSIRSYTLELITITVAREGGWSNTHQLLRKAMFKVRSCQCLKVAFDDNYRSSDFARGWRVPYVMDPANPYMNTLLNVVRNGDAKRIFSEAIFPTIVL